MRRCDRTSRRPLAAGKLRPSNALWFGISLSVLGGLYLAAINILTAVLALAALLSYLFLYTPLKRKTPLCTLVGAFPGAVTSFDRLGCGARAARSRSLGPVLHRLSLAVSSFHVHCLDVPPRLLAGRLSGLTCAGNREIDLSLGRASLFHWLSSQLRFSRL